uniref:WD_REPEATS_REGION domain-containing protein n=1 Tax=Echinostoma caproni TaxID=27848 RepID=A0A183BAT1_9TREM
LYKLIVRVFSFTLQQLLRIIYTDPGHKFLCVTDRPSIGVGPLGGPPSSPAPSSSGLSDSAVPSPSSPTVPSFSDSSFSAPSNGCCVRTVCISPDCRHLAAGDRDGQLR